MFELRTLDEAHSVVIANRRPSSLNHAVVTKIEWLARLSCMTPARARTSFAGTTFR